MHPFPRILLCDSDIDVSMGVFTVWVIGSLQSEVPSRGTESTKFLPEYNACFASDIAYNVAMVKMENSGPEFKAIIACVVS